MPLDTTKFQHIWQEQAFYNMLSYWVQIENTCQKATWTHGSHAPEYRRCSLGTPGSQQKYLFFDSQTLENNLNNVNIIKVCVPTANDEDEWGIIQRHKYSACVRLKIQKLSPANMTVYHARLKWCGELKEYEILSVPPEQPLIRSPKKFRRIVQSIWASHLPRCNLDRETSVGWVWVKDPPPMAKRPTGVSTIGKKALQKKEDVWEASRTRR